MDIIESLHNTIILSSNSLHELYQSKYKLNNIDKINENNTEHLNISEKILVSFKSFYNRILYKNNNNNLKPLDISIYNENYQLNNEINNENINNDTLSMLKIIKENNNLIGIELDQQNKQINEINVNIENNNLKVKELNNNINFS
jgi:hypothetical protein